MAQSYTQKKSLNIVFFIISLTLCSFSPSAFAAEDHTNTGTALLRREEFKKAIAHFNKSIRKNSKDIKAYHNRGAAYCRLQQFDKGIADFSKIIVMETDKGLLYQMYLTRGRAYADKGDHAKALADYDEALKLKPNDPDALTARASLIAQSSNETLKENK